MKKIMSLSLLLPLIFVGCQAPTSADLPKPTPSPPLATQPVAKSKAIRVTAYIVEESFPHLRKNPDEAVVHQVKWNLSNGQQVVSSLKDIVFHITYGNESATVVRVPTVTIPTYYIFFQTLQKNKKGKSWVVKGVMDAPVEIRDYFEEEAPRLKLPMDHYVAGSFDLSEDREKLAWVFAGDKQIVLVGRYPISAIDPLKHTKPLTKYPLEEFSPPHVNRPGILKQHERLYFKGKQGQSILYYRDGEYIVWITGNISESEIRTLANSLSKTSSPSFPIK